MPFFRKYCICFVEFSRIPSICGFQVKCWPIFTPRYFNELVGYNFFPLSLSFKPKSSCFFVDLNRSKYAHMYTCIHAHILLYTHAHIYTHKILPTIYDRAYFVIYSYHNCYQQFFEILLNYKKLETFWQPSWRLDITRQLFRWIFCQMHHKIWKMFQGIYGILLYLVWDTCIISTLFYILVDNWDALVTKSVSLSVHRAIHKSHEIIEP